MLLNLFSIHAFATGTSGGIKVKNNNNTVTYNRYNSTTGQMERVTGTRGRGSLQAQTNRSRLNSIRRGNAALGPIRPR